MPVLQRGWAFPTHSRPAAMLLCSVMLAAAAAGQESEMLAGFGLDGEHQAFLLLPAMSFGEMDLLGSMTPWDAAPPFFYEGTEDDLAEKEYLRSELNWRDPRHLLAYSHSAPQKDLLVYFDAGDPRCQDWDV